MTILTISERPLKVSGSVSGTESKEQRVFLVTSDSAHESGYTLATALGSVGCGFLALHPTNPYAYHRGFTFSQPDAKTAYECVLEYSSLSITEQERDKGILDPRDRRLVWHLDKRKTTSAMHRDVKPTGTSSRAIVNAAGDYFDPPPEKEECVWLFKAEKNLPERPNWLIAYEDSINNSALNLPGGYVIPVGCAKFVIENLGTDEQENGFDFVKFKYMLELKPVPDSTNCFDGRQPYSTPAALAPDGWSLVALNQGLREVESGEPINITDGNGTDITSPWPLDQNGVKIAMPTPANVTFLVWDQYVKKDLTVLPLS